jgi:hypothetical protein
MSEEQKEQEPQEEMVHPWCGGCGHNYFREPKIPLSKAEERAKTDRCHYCIEDKLEEERQAKNPRRTVYGYEQGMDDWRDWHEPD